MKLPTHQELLNKRVHIGHLARKWHPTFAPFIFGKCNGIHIIDLHQTIQRLDRATKVMQEIISKGKKILFVATKKQAAARIQAFADDLSQPYVNTRWTGGTLTNFPTIRKSAKHLLVLEGELEESNSGKFTKHEQLKKQRKKQKIEKSFAGISSIVRPPAALFVIDGHKEATAVYEARKIGIPIFGIVDTNTSASHFDHPIPANDDATSSIDILLVYIYHHLSQTIASQQVASPPPRSNTSTVSSNTKPKLPLAQKVASSTDLKEGQEERMAEKQ